MHSAISPGWIQLSVMALFWLGYDTVVSLYTMWEKRQYCVPIPIQLVGYRTVLCPYSDTIGWTEDSAASLLLYCIPHALLRLSTCNTV
jgi:hypothetical protein